MANPRTPLAKAKLTGAAAKNPQRFRDRVEPESSPLGLPPKKLEEAEKAAWKDFKKEWPWLVESDRAAMVPLCKMRALVESGEAKIGMYTEYRLMLSAFGGTPTAKTKIALPKDDDADDPFADFGKMN